MRRNTGELDTRASTLGSSRICISRPEDMVVRETPRMLLWLGARNISTRDVRSPSDIGYLLHSFSTNHGLVTFLSRH